MWRASALAAALLLGLPAPAIAAPLGMRPLGAEFDAARTVGDGNWAFEGGGWLPSFDALSDSATEGDRTVYENWQQLPAWPDIRAQYGWGSNNELVAQLGPRTTAGFRKFFIRADAPWGGEYLQALMQFGGGFHVAARKPLMYVKLPAIYERGDWTFHVAGGGYYLFNDQPIVDGDFGMEYRPIPLLSVGGAVHLRMDAKKVTPMDGSWSFGGGLRFTPFPWACAQVEFLKDAGPPTPEGAAAPKPRIELPGTGIRASVTTYF